MNNMWFPEVLPDLLTSEEEAVDEVPWGAGVQCLFVLLDLRLDELSHLLNLGKNVVLVAGKTLHQPGEDVVHLWDRYFVETVTE